MDVIGIGETMISLTPNRNGLIRQTSSFEPRVAGTETNTLIGLSRLGHSTGFISRLGDDELGAMVLKELRGEGVDTTFIEFDSSHQTGLFLKEIINESDVHVYYYREHSAASQMNPNLLDESYISLASYLFITGITPAISESCKQTIFTAINMAKKNGVKIVFDPNIRKKLWSEIEARETLLDILKLSNIVLPGISEGQFLFDSNDPEEIGEKCMELGAELVVVKLGETGAYYCTSDQSDHVPSFPVKQVKDPVGAGDAFAAGLLSGLIDELSVNEAVKRACITGGYATTYVGDYEGFPDRSHFERLSSLSSSEDVSR
ncbi:MULTISPECIES: sugar kinase [Oceanobacillus]|uniref:2-keto-3-deoxygluconate kinase n=1 Tax=Oceanobacillus kimchii TaxID=746691 RepID=A0ABQ5TJ28_9BACI|nr:MULTISPECIES: sugar kinase [Oceanobacillus]MCT1575543.1 sugar kinase [Oceanobacillus kimchii]MCT2137174.1 sugar kinase [Oceanobacillus kimchii]OEH55359.1 2-dehydro-3-deoxygluconokinase [Oceanobacillus sp. E9]GLO66878.1 2-keto-3-deoxygluconate kinase [Oceanobacillus kimchii]